MTPHQTPHPPPETRPGLVPRLIHAWKAVLNAWKFTALGACVDMVFFFLFSWLATWTVVQISGPLSNIFELAGENLSALSKNLTNEEAGAAVLLHYEQFMAAYQSILQTAGLFLLGAFVLWMIFQSASWLIAHAIASGNRFSFTTAETTWASESKKELPPLKKEPARGHATKQEAGRASPEAITPYLKRFAALSTYGFIALLAILYGSMRFSVWINVSRMGEGIQTVVSILIAGLLFLILYILSCGYAVHTRAGVKESATAWYTNGKRLFPAFAIAMVWIYAGGYLLSVLIQSSMVITVLFAVLVYAPSFTFNRVLLVLSAKKD